MQPHISVRDYDHSILSLCLFNPGCSLPSFPLYFQASSSPRGETRRQCFLYIFVFIFTYLDISKYHYIKKSLQPFPVVVHASKTLTKALEVNERDGRTACSINILAGQEVIYSRTRSRTTCLYDNWCVLQLCVGLYSQKRRKIIEFRKGRRQNVINARNFTRRGNGRTQEFFIFFP